MHSNGKLRTKLSKATRDDGCHSVSSQHPTHHTKCYRSTRTITFRVMRWVLAGRPHLLRGHTCGRHGPFAAMLLKVFLYDMQDGCFVVSSYPRAASALNRARLRPS